MRHILDWFAQRSFRLKLIGAAVAAEIILIVALVSLGIQQMDKALADQFEVRIEQERILLNTLLATEIAEQDNSALELALQHARSEGKIEYAVLRDRKDNLIVATGWNTRRPLPQADLDVRKAADSGMVHLQQFVKLGGQIVGELHYGISTAFLQEARRDLLRQAIVVASAGILISLLGLFFIGFGMMQRLGSLANVARRLAGGDLTVRVATGSHDEIGRLGAAFNNMAQALDERIHELHASEERLALVMRGTSDGIWDWDVRRNISYFSPRFRELLGYDEEQEFRLMFQFRTALHPDDREHALAALDNALQHHARFDETYRLHCRDGSYRWFHGRGHAQWDESGAAHRFAGSLSDISARKAVEEALKQSEETLFYAVRGSSDGIWDWNVAQNRYFVSPRYRDLLGYSEEEMPNERSSFLDVVHPEDRPRVEEAVRQHFKQRTPYDIEYRMRHKDGSYRWFRGRGQAVWNADGRVIRFAGASSDIEAQKQAEDSIRSLLAEQQALLDNVLVGIVYLKNRIIQRCNRRFEALFGYEEGGMIGHTTELVYPTRTTFEAVGKWAYAALGRGETYSEELQLRHRDGSLFWGFLTGRAVDAARPQDGSVWIYLDVSERKKAMEALRESEARFRKFFEESADASLIIEGDRFVDCNQAALDMLRMASKEKLGIVHPSELSPERQPDGRLSNEKADEMIRIAFARGSHRFEWLHRRADGEVFPAEVLLTRIVHQGTPLLYVVWRDITDRKLAEAEIRKLNEGLEQRVRERTAELTAANKELEAFSYSVSHDLVAPLRAIDGFSRMLEEDYVTHLDASARGYISRIRGGTQRMHQLIDDMLALSRVTRDEMKRETVNLSGIAEQILSDLKQIQPQRKVSTHITSDIRVNGDPNLLRIALENLLRNAWKFTARQAAAAIEFGILRDGDNPVYFVRDDGAGFDMQYAGKLFGAFQRMHHAQDFEGTGIGLAIVHRIIQRHGGRIWAEAAPEQGATFYFTLS
ncbi:MAG: PAS domain S-box protein [Rhodocyclales bacterium]|nr:PAS domain S-box protein [Rhodocyclales bacterium]